MFRGMCWCPFCLHRPDLAFPTVLQVQCLGQVRRLDLSHTGVVDVSGLGRVLELNLAHTGVEDVSGLGSVHRLCLAHCRKVRDVRMLSRVRELDVTFCISLEHPLPLPDALPGQVLRC